MSSMLRPLALVRGILVAFCLLALAPAGAGAAAPARWGQLAQEGGRSWLGEQNRNGTFRDYVYGGHISVCMRKSCHPPFGNARYGESALGYAMIATGLRTGDRKLTDAGLRAINYAVRQRKLQKILPTNFESMSVASAYNLARHRLAKRPLFARNRAKWESWMRHVKPQWIGNTSRAYYNHHLVEVVSNLELWRSGLRSHVKGAELQPKTRKRQERLTRQILAEEIPSITTGTRRQSRGVTTEVLSDQPDFPLPYHGLSIGLYARAVQLMGRRAPKVAVRVLQRLANTSWLLSGPDGDVAYTGRSQEDVWALPATAFGAEFASHLPGTSVSESARYQAVADRTIARMDAAYPRGPKGLWIVPALAVDPLGGIKALDFYAGGAAFSGLALMQLEWAIGAASKGSRAPGELAADSAGSGEILRGDDSTVFVRSGDLWYSVKQANSFTSFPGDLRWDFGMVALKQLRNGSWSDLQPLRPVTDRTPAQSAGPQLKLKRDGKTGIPYGEGIGVSGAGVTTITGGWREPYPSKRFLRRGAKFRFEPVGCGVRLTFPAEAGDKLEYSAFLRGTKGDVQVGGGLVTDATQAVTFSTPATVKLDGGYASAADPHLVRARISFEPSAAATLAVTVCSR
ncbi:MAG: hypothetical protein QOG63_181 [Thermoleophilaceae bacterium]|nr:hypothetical protein [Thermoleophilaceae bacterium]